VPERQAGLDNFVGASGGHPRPTQHAERTLLSCCFDALDLDVIEGRVLSYNHGALTLHEEAGFEIARSIPLRKVVEGDRVTHLDATEGEANVGYTREIIVLTRAQFRGGPFGSWDPRQRAAPASASRGAASDEAEPSCGANPSSRFSGGGRRPNTMSNDARIMIVWLKRSTGCASSHCIWYPSAVRNQGLKRRPTPP
jgi:hypothetical protein